MVSTSLSEYGLSADEMALLSENRPRTSSTPEPRVSFETEVTSSDHIALQFYWQGAAVFPHCRVGDSAATCFYGDDCGCAADANACAEFVRILPVSEVQGRSIVDSMQVQILSVNTGQYLRTSRISKHLRWSDDRDEQTIFWIEMADRSKSLTDQVQFKLESFAYPGYYVGFTRTGGSSVGKPMGSLTLKKKKPEHAGSLVFPIRFLAVHRADRLEPTLNSTKPQASSPVPLVTTNHVIFIDEAQEDTLAEIPMAMLLSLRQEAHAHNHTVVKCSYCHQHLRSQTAMVDHIRRQHGEWLHRESRRGSYCTCCGRRKVDDSCPRCSNY